MDGAPQTTQRIFEFLFSDTNIGNIWIEYELSGDQLKRILTNFSLFLSSLLSWIEKYVRLQIRAHRDADKLCFIEHNSDIIKFSTFSFALFWNFRWKIK